jgi:DNA-binding transcriptional LysR family regulator
VRFHPGLFLLETFGTADRFAALPVTNKVREPVLVACFSEKRFSSAKPTASDALRGRATSLRSDGVPFSGPIVVPIRCRSDPAGPLPRRQRKLESAIKREQAMSALPALRDLHKLNAFFRAAESQSFTKAAQDLRTSPSVISKHISDLERNLGFSLLRRSTHGVSLTEAGKGLFEYCLKYFAGLDDYVIGTRNSLTGPIGFLRVQTSSEFARWILAPAIRDFLKGHPKLRIEVMTQSGPKFDQECDVVLTSIKPKVPGLTGETLSNVSHVVCATRKYLQTHGKPKTVRELQRHNCLIDSATASKTSTAAGSAAWRFRSGNRVELVEVKGSFCSDSAAMLRQIALDHVGIARLPKYSVEGELRNGKLVSLFDGSVASHEEISAYYSKATLLPAKITTFLQFLRKRLVAGG